MLLALQFRLLCVLVAFLLILTTVMQLLGGLEPPHPALEGFISGCDDKPQPCWYGIVVGVTTWEEAQPILQAAGYAASPTNDAPRPDLCDLDTGVASGETRTITIMQFVPCPGLRLGDVVQMFGPPDKLTTLHDYNYPLLVYEHAFDISVAVPQTNSLYAPIFSVEMWADGPDMIGDLANWRGYLRHERYCQYEPEILYCQYN